MILSSKSLLRNIPVNLHPSQVLVFDSIRYSIDIADIAYNRLIDNLYQLSFPKDNQTPSFPLIFSDVWSIINNLTTFINIVTKHFSIDEKDPIFNRIRILKHLRHSNQHIEDRLNQLENPYVFPIYGKLSWYAQKSLTSREGVLIALYSGSVIDYTNVEVPIYNPSGRINDKLINGIEFTGMIRLNDQLSETKINLLEIILNITEIINYFEIQLKEQFNQSAQESRPSNDLIIRLPLKKLIDEDEIKFIKINQ